MTEANCENGLRSVKRELELSLSQIFPWGMFDIGQMGWQTDRGDLMLSHKSEQNLSREDVQGHPSARAGAWMHIHRERETTREEN
jgi:hypothetical protein